MSLFSRPILRAAVTAVSLVALAGFAWASWLVYRSKTSPETFRAWDGPSGWIVGPPAESLAEAAMARVQIGLEALNDTSRSPAERLRTYREELIAADALLVRSLRARPTQPRVLASLASTRWELTPPLTDDDSRHVLDIMELAARMAPTSPRVHMQLGEVLLKMGRRDDSAVYFTRTVELDATRTDEVVKIMNQHLAAEDIRDALPVLPEVVIALRRPYFDEGRHEVYLELVDEALRRSTGAPPRILMESFGGACLRTGQAERLLRRMDELGELPTPATEAERLRQRSRARLALGAAVLALEDARVAVDLVPGSIAFQEHLGDVALAADDADLAHRSFRSALGLAARGPEQPGLRARLYRKTGQVEERRGNPDRAINAYQLALDLDAGERIAQQRLQAITRGL